MRVFFANNMKHQMKWHWTSWHILLIAQKILHLLSMKPYETWGYSHPSSLARRRCGWSPGVSFATKSRAGLWSSRGKEWETTVDARNPAPVDTSSSLSYYPIIYKGFYTCQVVVSDFFHCNSSKVIYLGEAMCDVVGPKNASLSLVWTWANELPVEGKCMCVDPIIRYNTTYTYIHIYMRMCIYTGYMKDKQKAT